MSLYLLGKPLYFDFTTHDPTTGSVSDADSLPTAKVFEENGSTSMYSPTVAKRGSETGNYIVTIVATTANGFELDKCYNVIVQATVNSVVAKARIAQFVLESQSVSNIESFKVGQQMRYGIIQPRKGSSEKLVTLTRIK